MTWTSKTIAALATLLLTGCGQAAGEGPGRAQVVFADNCAPCHGEAGQGKYEVRAPRIAGLPEWYVERQLHKFRDGVRGAHASDIEGLRMRPMSRTIEREEFQAMAAYVASMPAPPADAEGNNVAATGDAGTGKNYYATCAACHGQNGMGNEALNAPPIAQLDAWYIDTQLHKYRTGIRGAHPRDVEGAQMAPMAKALPSDEALTDVAAYISTL